MSTSLTRINRCQSTSNSVKKKDIHKSLPYGLHFQYDPFHKNLYLFTSIFNVNNMTKPTFQFNKLMVHRSYWGDLWYSDFCPNLIIVYWYLTHLSQTKYSIVFLDIHTWPLCVDIHCVRQSFEEMSFLLDVI